MSQVPRHDQSIITDQCPTRGSDPLLAVVCEGQFRGAGMTAVEGPFRLAVADDEYSRGCH
jgi:hypothetical protein